MKKTALIILAVFAALFVVITLSKREPAKEAAKEQANSATAIEKEKVLKFWERFRKATDYRMNEQWSLAAENYRQALELNGRHEDALYYLGNMYLELSQFREAEACWKKLVEVNPKNSRGSRQLANLYLESDELFDIDKAEAACRETIRINKEESGPMLSMGEIMLIRGRLDEAAADFAAVTASNFKSTGAYFLGGYVAWKKGEKAKARELFGLAVKYAKPEEHKAGKVIGEGDTKPGKGFGNVTSKSIFRGHIAALSSVRPEEMEPALEKSYRQLDLQLTELKRKVH